MEEQRVTLWCKVLGKLVEVVIVKGRAAQPPVPGLPKGWKVSECVDKDVECFGRDCPFTTDGGDSPFGEIGEPPAELSPERFDPMTEPGFEGEWS